MDSSLNGLLMKVDNFNNTEMLCKIMRKKG